MPCSPEGRNDRRINQFEKICTLNDLAGKIAQVFSGEKLAARMNQECGIVPEGSFDEVVDLEHAHMSLTGLMNTAEKRFAFAATKVMQENKVDISLLEDLVYNTGLDDAAPAGSSLSQVCDYFMMRYLDGMPCDQTKEALGQGPDFVSWKKVIDCHSSFWEEIGGDPSDYEALITCYANGLFSKAGYQLTIKDHEIFTISPK